MLPGPLCIMQCLIENSSVKDQSLLHSWFIIHVRTQTFLDRGRSLILIKSCFLGGEIALEPFGFSPKWFILAVSFVFRFGLCFLKTVIQESK